MDGAGKIAAGIVLAAVIVVVGIVGYKEFDRRREMRDAAEIIDHFNRQIAATSQEFQRQQAVDRELNSAASLRAAELSERKRVARMLLPSERCIGGTVVQVNGSSYTQVSGQQGRPVACSGRYRL